MRRTASTSPRRPRRYTGAAAVAVAGLLLAACGGGGNDPLASGGDKSSGSGSGGSGSVTIGSANFYESSLLAEIYAGALEAKGVKVDTKLNIGAREVYLKAMEPGDASVDIIPEYTGVLRDYYKPDQKGTTSDEVYQELTDSLPKYVTALDPSAAEDKDGVVVTQATADKYSLKSIGDLASVAGDLTLGGPPEWKTRQTGVPGLKKVYGVEFGSFRVLDAGGPLTLRALVNGQIDAGNLFTTDPNIVPQHLVALEDPKSLFAAQNVVPLVRTEALTDTIKTTLNAVSAALDTQTLVKMDAAIVIDKKDPVDVAKQFLTDNNLG
jgi:osmoprotectant transport system substrate-binding protein